MPSEDFFYHFEEKKVQHQILHKWDQNFKQKEPFNDLVRPVAQMMG